jgi:hypothetical protein
MNFRKWWASVKKEYKWLFLITLFLYTNSALVEKGVFAFSETQAFLDKCSVFDLIQAFFVLITLVILAANGRKELSTSAEDPIRKLLPVYNNEQEWASAINRANNTLKNIVDWLIFLWFTWLILYALFAAKTQADQPYYHILTNVINITGSIICYIIYLELSHRRGRKQYSKLGWFVLPILVAMEAFFIKNPNFYIFNFVVELFVGILSTIAFIFLFGKLNSRLLNLPQPVILMLYAYATIQALYPLLGIKEIKFIPEEHSIPGTAMAYIESISDTTINTIKSIIKIIALIGKITLFLVFTTIINNGRLVYYILIAEFLEKKLEADIKEFEGKYELKKGIE